MLVDLIHSVAGFITLAEALNKLDRCQPLQRGLGWRKAVTEWLKALAWLLLALGGAGAMVAPLWRYLPMPPSTTELLALLMPLQGPTVQDVCLALGFVVLIVRTRVKEG